MPDRDDGLSVCNNYNNCNQITCLECGKTSTSNEVFIEHYRTEHMYHGDGGVFHCKLCMKTFVSSHSFIAHLQDMHQRLQFHACVLCDKHFISNCDLQRHLITHDIKFTIAPNLLEPSFNVIKTKEATHQRIRRYACYLCHKSFVRKFNMKLHMNIHTGMRTYTCHLCDKSYRHPSYLNAHRKICRLDLSLLSHT